MNKPDPKMVYRARKTVVRPWMAADAEHGEYPGIAVTLPEGAIGVTVTPIKKSDEVAVCWLEPGS